MVDLAQVSLKRLKTKIAESAKQVVFCVGSGLSTEAGAPSWKNMRDLLANEAFSKLENISDPEADQRESELNYYLGGKDYWDCFGLIKNILGDIIYYRRIKEMYDHLLNKTPPEIYNRIWGLKGVNAVVTPNIDNFAQDSHRLTRPAQTYISCFNNLNIKDRFDVVRNTTPFIFNMHGNFDQESSLVFTKDEINKLMKDKAYYEFMKSIFYKYSVVFLAISADDKAFDEILSKIHAQGVSLSDHYWITSRSDMRTYKWSSKYGIETIIYDVDHSADIKETHTVPLNKIFDEIERYTSYDQAAPAVIPSSITNVSPQSPGDLMAVGDNNVRRLILAGMAKDILVRNNQDTKCDEYQSFIKNYALPIHTAWFISSDAPGNDFMNYKIVSREVDGKFSNIWGIESEGESYILKMLQQENIKELKYLDSFRRGVQSLRYLAAKGVGGAVRLIDAYEIPASLIMERIYGINLEDFARRKEFNFWLDGLPALINVCEHIMKCHELPETIFHRDIRPRNIILDSILLDSNNYSIKMINYDMSWHKDARGYDMEATTSQLGYQPTELVAARNMKVARSASVDVYGIGMTIYYLCSKENPPLGGSNSKDWEATVTQKFRPIIFNNWKSAGKRVERVVLSATMPDPRNRPSLAQVHANLLQLYEISQNNLDHLSSDFWAEEVIARTGFAYRQSTGENSFSSDILAGFTTIVRGDENDGSICAVIQISAVGGENWENIGKRIKGKFDESVRTLKEGGWKILTETTIGARDAKISAKISVNDLRDRLEARSNVLARVMQCMKI
jgi:serine/threonine protein kinase